MTVRIASRQKWLKYRAPNNRNVEHLFSNSFTQEPAENHRRICAAVLSNGGEEDRELGEMLSEAETGKPAETFCCPLVARKFQTFFVSRALKVIAGLDGAVLLTVFDAKDAVENGDLRSIDWRKRHARLRRRLERCLGPSVIAVGMGEVEYDETLKKWQPHHHLVLYGTTDDGLAALRRAHYASQRGEARPMVRSKETTLIGWLSYMAKQTAFRKIRIREQVSRVRLKPAELREFLRYAASKNPTSFVFAMNCDLIKRTDRAVASVNKTAHSGRRVIERRSPKYTER